MKHQFLLVEKESALSGTGLLMATVAYVVKSVPRLLLAALRAHKAVTGPLSVQNLAPANRIGSIAKMDEENEAESTDWSQLAP